MSTLKSKLIKLIMAGLLVLTTFAFVSCGGNPNPDSGSGAGSGGGGGSDAGGGSSGSGSIMTEQQIKGKLANLEAYRIKCKINTSDWKTEDSTRYCEIGKTQDTYWLLEDGQGYASVIDGEYVYSYRSYPDENGNADWEYSEINNYREDKIEDDLESMYNTFGTGYGLFYINDNQEGLTNKGSRTVAGRNCTLYSKTETESSNGMSFSESSDIYVDNETGITMKVEETYSLNGQGYNQSYSWGYEVTTFETGNAVVAPTLPDPEPASDED